MRIGKWKIDAKDGVWFFICGFLVVSFLVGLIIYDKANAASALSAASTAVSIVLSIVAILYTMIEGANSSRINDDTAIKLDKLDNHLGQIEKKLAEQKELQSKINIVLPELISHASILENKSIGSGEGFTVKLSEELANLKKYMDEDIEEE